MKNFLKILLGIVSAILVIVLAIFLFADSLAEHYLRRSLQKAGKGSYTLSLDGVDVDLLNGNISIAGIELATDSTTAAQIGTVPLWVSGDRIALKGFNLWEFLFKDAVVADSIMISDTSIKWNSKQKEQTDNQQQSLRELLYNLDAYASIRDHIQRFELKALILQNVNLEQLPSNKDAASPLVIRQLFLNVHDVVVDASTFFNNERILYAKGIHFFADTILIQEGKTVAALNLTNMSVNLDNNLLTASLSKVSGESQTARGDSLKFYTDSLYIHKLDIFSAIEQQSIKLNYLMLLQPVVNGSTTAAGDSNSEAQTVSNFSLQTALRPFFNSVYADSVLVVQAAANINQFKTSQVNLKIQALQVDSKTAFANNRFFHAETFQLTVDSTSFEKDSTFIGWASAELSFTDGAGFFNTNAFVFRSHTYDLSLPEALINSFSITPEANKVLVKTFFLKKPNAIVQVPFQKYSNSSTDNQPLSSLQQYLQPYLESLYFGNLHLAEGSLKLINSQGKAIVLSTGLNMHANDFAIDERSAFADERFWYAQDAILSMDNFLYLSTDGRYSIKAKKLALSTDDKQIIINNLQVIPLGKNKRFWYDVPFESAYYLDLAWLSIEDIQWKEMFLDHYFNIGRLSGRKVDFRIFNNIHKTKKNEVKAMPQDMITSDRFDYVLQQLDIVDANIIYYELSNKADSAGLIYFSDMQISANRITDDPELLKIDSDIKLTASTKLMGKAQLSTELTVHMLAPDKRVTMKGEMGAMSATTFNSIAKFNSPIMIKSGEILQGKWEISADAQLAKGEMQFFYRDLHVRVNLGNRADTTGTFQNLVSALVNTLIINDERLPKDEDIEPQYIEIERDPHKSFFNYYWKSLLDGIKKSMGVPRF